MTQESVLRVIPEEMSHEGFKEKFEAVLGEVLQREDVREATQKAEAVGAVRERLMRAQKNLYARQSEVAKSVRLLRENAAPVLIHDFGDESPQIDTAKLVGKSLTLQEEERLLVVAIQRLIEQDYPRATIQFHRLEAERLALAASALEGVAQERAQRLAQMVAQAADFEGDIGLDTSRGLSGALLSAAAMMREQGQAALRAAVEEEERWRNIRRAQHMGEDSEG